jgi:hypothetical protein
MDPRNRRKWEDQIANAYLTNADELRNAIVNIAWGDGTTLDLSLVPWSVIENYQGDLAKDLNPLVRDAWLSSARDVLSDLNLGINWNMMNYRASTWAEGYTYDLVKDLTARDMVLLQDTISRKWETGMSLAEVRNILETSPAFGPARAELIAITETTRSSVQGELAAVAEAGAQGMPLVSVWNTNVDETVCPKCEPFNGKKLGDGWDTPPPYHPGCRCYLNHFPADRVPGYETQDVTPPPALDPFPADLDKLEVVQQLGGSTGAQLVRDPDTGKLFVMKSGASPEHVQREFLADNVYRALGMNVPEARLYATPGGPVKLAEFIDGKSLGDLLKSGDPMTKQVLEELRRGFAADAMLANWDVIGLNYDNILVDTLGKVWRIDNGSSFDFRAMGSRKIFDTIPMEFWTMRDPVINPSAYAIFGPTRYDDIIQQMIDLGSRKNEVLALLPTDLADVYKLRMDRVDDAIKLYYKFLGDGFEGQYLDGFTRHTFGLEKAGVFNHFPKVLDNQVYQGVVVYDENGRAFDALRNYNGITPKIKDYINANGGNYQAVSDYFLSQGGSSWSDASAAAKQFISMNLKHDPSEIFYGTGGGGQQYLLDAYNRMIGTYTERAYANSMQTVHAYTYRLLSETDFKGNDPARGVINLIRTEKSHVLSGYGLDLGDKDVVFPRGFLESSSVFKEVYIGTDSITYYREVPHTRVFANYFNDWQVPGSGYSPLLGDHENEFLFIPYRLKVEWTFTKGRGGWNPSP